MAPIPFSAPGRLNIEITVSGLVHKLRVPVNLVLPYVAPAHFIIRNPPAGLVLGSAAAQALWALLAPNYATTVLTPSYLIEWNASGVFVPVESGVLFGNGSSIAPTALTSQLTLTYKDDENRKMKIVALEQAIPAPAHGTSPSGDAPLDALIANVLAASVPTDLGNWMVSRSQQVITRFTFFTVSLNKRVRRSRHLV